MVEVCWWKLPRAAFVQMWGQRLKVKVGHQPPHDACAVSKWKSLLTKDADFLLPPELFGFRAEVSRVQSPIVEEGHWIASRERKEGTHFFSWSFYLSQFVEMREKAWHGHSYWIFSLSLSPLVWYITPLLLPLPVHSGITRERFLFYVKVVVIWAAKQTDSVPLNLTRGPTNQPTNYIAMQVDVTPRPSIPLFYANPNLVGWTKHDWWKVRIICALSKIKYTRLLHVCYAHRYVGISLGLCFISLEAAEWICPVPLFELHSRE